VSIDLMDVAINCLATLQSDFTETFPLKSSNLKVDIGWAACWCSCSLHVYDV